MPSASTEALPVRLSREAASNTCAMVSAKAKFAPRKMPLRAVGMTTSVGTAMLTA